MTALRVEKKRLSFNRYMVECEYWFPVPLAYTVLVLIDTWWNVNMNFPYLSHIPYWF